MFYISHRGNINGPNKKEENKPEYINVAIQNGYDVEIDVRFKNSQFYLGHDFAEYKVDESFLLNKKIWCHAKTTEALIALEKIDAHYFWHQEDDYTITSAGWIWAYPGKPGNKRAIAVMPELEGTDVTGFSGICSDYIANYVEK